MAMQQLVLLCREGFEGEAAAEIQTLAGEAGCYGYCKTHQGWVSFVADDSMLKQVIENIPFEQLIFTRQWFIAGDEIALDGQDRVSNLTQNMQGVPECGQLEIIHCDTNEGKELSRLCKTLTGPLAAQLRKQQRMSAKRTRKLPRLMVLLLDGKRALLGFHHNHNASQWPDGILRLKFPKDAPSRSTLKLEEAWHQFIPKPKWDDRLAHGMRAVDLGAAPGGWTYQLVKRSMMVDAIDNGPMKGDLMESGQVTHHQEDGFKYHPTKKVHWMVCDMAESPMKVTKRMTQWIANDWCGEAIFNLKLPMKKRYQEVQDCIQYMQDYFAEHEIEVTIRCKHLYHDREEVTCHIARLY
ncbi:23S rRNA (cytidine(2498)-2'-O)-methyltransferase RlmM [Bermanella sp. R86510]|uniref:23S rRNA (cytidine(2498)-2'-O)-methyltransferase RlmM n=1 Tax=unclassified Bermanella TaxID=2627862 RepID=UPI0037C54D00